MNYAVKPIHINQVMSGDTIMHYGAMMTVCKSNIKDDGFLGRTIFGDSYKMGNLPVQLVQFTKSPA